MGLEIIWTHEIELDFDRIFLILEEVIANKKGVFFKLILNQARITS